MFHRAARLVLAVALAALFPLPAWAAPKTGEKQEPTRLQQVAQAVEQLKELPDQARGILFAEYLNIYYKEDGNHAYNGSRHWPDPGAVFISTKGETWEYWKARNMVSGAQWNRAQDVIRSVGWNAIATAFDEEITCIALQNAKHLLETMPPIMRDAWLAKECGLLKLPGSWEKFLRAAVHTTDAGLNIHYTTPVDAYDTFFIDSEEKKRRFSDAWEPNNTRWWRRWYILHQCAQLAGSKNILKLLPNEVSALRRNNKNFATPRKGKKNAKPAISVSSGVPLAVNLVRKLNIEAREALFADMLGTFYMPSGESGLNEQGNVRQGALFVGSDGEVHDFHAAVAQADPEVWQKARALFLADNPYTIFSYFSKDISHFTLQTTKRHLQSMPEDLRLAWLAEIAGLLCGSHVYVPNLKDFIGERHIEVAHTLVRRSPYFRDTNGQEHPYWDTLSRHKNTWERRRQICYLSLRFASFKETLDLFADQVAELREVIKPEL